MSFQLEDDALSELRLFCQSRKDNNRPRLRRWSSPSVLPAAAALQDGAGHDVQNDAGAGGHAVALARLLPQGADTCRAGLLKLRQLATPIVASPADLPCPSNDHLQMAQMQRQMQNISPDMMQTAMNQMQASSTAALPPLASVAHPAQL